jgi:hypothetical protein
MVPVSRLCGRGFRCLGATTAAVDWQRLDHAEPLVLLKCEPSLSKARAATADPSVGSASSKAGYGTWVRVAVRVTRGRSSCPAFRDATGTRRSLRALAPRRRPGPDRPHSSAASRLRSRRSRAGTRLQNTARHAAATNEFRSTTTLLSRRRDSLLRPTLRWANASASSP